MKDVETSVGGCCCEEEFFRIVATEGLEGDVEEVGRAWEKDLRWNTGCCM